MATFGERFKKERLEKGLTQEQLAKHFFLNKSSISRYEKNKQIPEMDTLQSFADFFNCSVDYLLGNTDIRNNLKTSDLFSGSGGLQLDSIKQALLKTNKNNNLLFSIMLEEKLKEANLYNDNMSDEEKVKLANKVLDILKLIKNK